MLYVKDTQTVTVSYGLASQYMFANDTKMHFASTGSIYVYIIYIYLGIFFDLDLTV